MNLDGTYIDVEDLHDDLLSMEDCYEGYLTRGVELEERNVLCSSYNVLVLDPRYINLKLGE